MKNLNKKGFTLIEMLIVVVIIGILAAALIPRLGSAKGKANDSARSTAMAQIGTALGMYVLDYGLPTAVNGSTTDATYPSILNKGNLLSIPVDPSAKSRTPFGGTATTGYAIFQVKKGTTTGFAIVANVESPTSANWADNGTATAPRSGGTTDMGSFGFCKTMSEDTATNPTLIVGGDCKAQNGKWRKIVVY